LPLVSAAVCSVYTCFVWRMGQTFVTSRGVPHSAANVAGAPEMLCLAECKMCS
jgi:hypothetical protein